MTRFRFIATASLLITLYLNFPIAAQDAEKQLRWKLQQGEKLDVALTQTTGIKTAIQNRIQKIGNDMMLTMRWKVSEANETNFVLNQTIKRIQLTVTAPSKGAVQITKIDTDAVAKPTPFGQRLLKQVQPLIGAQFTVSMSDRGQITGVEIPQATMETLRSAPASMQLRELLTEKGLMDLLGQSAIVFPEKSLKAGDQWNSTTEIKNQFATITRGNQYTYDGNKESDGQSFDSFSVATQIDSTEASANNAIEKFSGRGQILYSAMGRKVLDSQLANEMTTARKYRDQTIRTTVNTKVEMKVTRADD